MLRGLLSLVAATLVLPSGIVHDICLICFDSVPLVSLGCRHVLCGDCIPLLKDIPSCRYGRDGVLCPVCKALVDSDEYARLRLLPIALIQAGPTDMGLHVNILDDADVFRHLTAFAAPMVVLVAATKLYGEPSMGSIILAFFSSIVASEIHIDRIKRNMILKAGISALIVIAVCTMARAASLNVGQLRF